MSKLYYGGGLCSINPEGSKIKAIYITYKGDIKINDLTSDSFFINAIRNKILIIPIGKGYLTDLFNYEGEFKVKSIICLDEEGNTIKTTRHRNLSYPYDIKTKAEDLKLKPEELNKSLKSTNISCDTTLDKLTLNNLHTNNLKYDLFDKDGNIYNGFVHIHLKNNQVMTGNKHSNESRNLYKGMD
jgi:hypothetical protein